MQVNRRLTFYFCSFPSSFFFYFRFHGLFLWTLLCSFFTYGLVEGATINGFAACKSDPLLNNSPYCPQLTNNLQSPVNGETYTVGTYMTCSWNSKWNSFASTGLVDIYLCPNSAPLNCVSVSKSVPSNVEQLSFLLTPESFTEGPYFYLVVASGGSVNVPFSDRGASITILKPKPSTTSSSNTPTSLPSSNSNMDSTPTSSSSNSASSTMNATTGSSLSSLTITLIVVGSGLFVVVVLLSVFLYIRYRKLRHTSSSTLPSSFSALVLPPPPPPRPTSSTFTPSTSSSSSSTTTTTTTTPLPPPPTASHVPKGASFSTGEAILLANSFKLALRSPWTSPEQFTLDSLDSESVEETLSELGMKSLPRTHVSSTPISSSSSPSSSSSSSLSSSSSSSEGFTVEPIQSNVKPPEPIREVKRGTSFNLEQTVVP